jgi:hypothetical protein
VLDGKNRVNHIARTRPEATSKPDLRPPAQAPAKGCGLTALTRRSAIELGAVFFGIHVFLYPREQLVSQ